MRRLTVATLSVGLCLFLTGCSDSGTSRSRRMDNPTTTADHGSAMNGTGGTSAANRSVAGGGETGVARRNSMDARSGSGTSRDQTDRSAMRSQTGSTSGSGTSLSGTAGHGSPNRPNQ